MPIAVVCPGCTSRLNAPDAAAGKTVKCPKCKEAMVIPEPEADAGFETVDEPTPPKKPVKAPAVKSDVMLDDDEDEKPRAKKKPRDDEDEDDEDERPKKKSKGKKKAKAGLAPAVLIGAIAGGVLLLGGGGFAVYWFGIREIPPKETAGNTTPNLPPGGPQQGGPSQGGPGPTPPVQPGGPVKPLYETATSTHRQISSNNMKQFGLAMHNFASTYNGAFAAGIYDSTGRSGSVGASPSYPSSNKRPFTGNSNSTSRGTASTTRNSFRRCPSCSRRPASSRMTVTPFTGASLVRIRCSRRQRPGAAANPRWVLK